jgi:hypothetical protein
MKDAEVRALTSDIAQAMEVRECDSIQLHVRCHATAVLYELCREAVFPAFEISLDEQGFH